MCGNRDPEILHAFELSDDAITAVLGYSYYAMAALAVAQDKKAEVSRLIPESSIQITHEWARYYNPHQLTQVMSEMSELVNARLCIVLVVGIFEAGLTKMVDRIVALGRDSASKKALKTYKSKLCWGINKVLASTYGSPEMQQRRPQLCLDLDHARRIRNLMVHNNGLFNSRFEEDAIKIPGHSPLFHPSLTKFRTDQTQAVPLLLTWNDFNLLTLSHIEFLHHLHDCIQRGYFGCTDSYSYIREKKPIDWVRLLRGH